MFFKRPKKNNPSTADDSENAAAESVSGEADINAPSQSKAVEEIASSNETAAPSVSAEPRSAAALKPEDLTHTIDATGLGFEWTNELTPETLPVGQDKATATIRTALSMRPGSTHVLVVGPRQERAHGAEAPDMRHDVLQILSHEVASRPRSDDLVYVHNFSSPESPKPLRLPPGRARQFAGAVSNTIKELCHALQGTFASEDYAARRRAIHERFRGTHEETFETLRLTAREQNIALLRSPTGYAFAPTLDGKVVNPDVFAKLPPTMQTEVSKKIETLEADLRTILENEPRAERARRVHLSNLEAEVAERVVESVLADIRKDFADIEAVTGFLADLAEDVTVNAGLFAAAAKADPANPHEDAALNRYRVVVLRDDTESADPLLVFDPVSDALAGTIAGGGARSGSGPHVGQLRSGAFHRANGGVLLIDARDLVGDPAERQALREALSSGRIVFRRGRGPERAAALASLAPEPIPLHATVVVMATHETATKLNRVDPELTAQFAFQTQLAAGVEHTSDAERAMAARIAAIIARDNLKVCSAEAVACLIEHAARRATCAGELSTSASALSSLARHADILAEAAGRERIERNDVEQAVHDEIKRLSATGAPFRPLSGKPAIGCVVAAAEVGNAPGLGIAPVTALPGQSALGVAQFEINVAAQVLSMIGRRDAMWIGASVSANPGSPNELTATLSAAASIAYVSALAGVPLRQDVVLAAGADASGELVTAPNINDTIEQAFATLGPGKDASSPGVIIADSDKHRLMLSKRVIDAVSAGEFAVFAARDLTEAIDVLAATGEQAPARDVLAKAADRYDALLSAANTSPGIRGAKE